MSVVAAAVIGSAVVGGVAANSASKKAAKSQQAAIDANAYQGEIATDQYDEYKTTYRPLERQVVADAQNYDTPEAYDKAAAEAQATTSQQIGLAQERLSRTPGLDPSSAAAQSGQTKLALQGAALGAGAQNSAREGIRDKAWARKMDALGLGKGLVANASSGLAANARQSASLADSARANASASASGVGSLASGIANLGIKAYNGYSSPSPNSLGAVGSSPMGTFDVSPGVATGGADLSSFTF
jgi:hypothetical protein